MENLFLLILKKFEKLRNSSLLVYKVGYEIKKSLGLKVDRISHCYRRMMKIVIYTSTTKELN